MQPLCKKNLWFGSNHITSTNKINDTVLYRTFWSNICIIPKIQNTCMDFFFGWWGTYMQCQMVFLFDINVYCVHSMIYIWLTFSQWQFGEVDIDSSLVASHGTTSDDIVMVNNGCLCCTVRGELVKMLLELVKKQRDKFDHIVIETTGTAAFSCNACFVACPKFYLLFASFLIFIDASQKQNKFMLTCYHLRSNLAPLDSDLIKIVISLHNFIILKLAFIR